MRNTWTQILKSEREKTWRKYRQAGILRLSRCCPYGCPQRCIPHTLCCRRIFGQAMLNDQIRIHYPVGCSIKPHHLSPDRVFPVIFTVSQSDTVHSESKEVSLLEIATEKKLDVKRSQRSKELPGRLSRSYDYLVVLMLPLADSLGHNA